MNHALVRPRLYAIAGMLAAMILAGCASGPSIYVNADPSANFAGYRTYNFMTPLGTDRPGYSSVLSEYLRTAASRELEARGYQKSDNPDMLVNFNVQTKEKVQSTTMPSGPAYGGYYGYRSGYYGTWGGYETQVTQYTEGTLTVDVVDAARKQLAWDGTAVGRVREEARKNLQPAVDKVMAQIFEKFPSRKPTGALTRSRSVTRVTQGPWPVADNMPDAGCAGGSRRMRVLFVDDEPNVLDSIRRQLRKSVDIHTAASGDEALRLLNELGPVALVISDMRMPGMTGAELLTRVRELYPDTVRMILSGQADLESTISAVNEGHIFRFLTKPCGEESLRNAVAAGIEQYSLVTTRKELVEKTLQGLVETLNDILGLTNPMARRRTARVRQYATAIASALKFSMPWDLRLATLLSQLGCITLPESILDKLYAGTALTGDEQSLYARHPEVAAALIGRIPQLGSVADMIGRQQRVDFAALSPDVADWDADTTATVILAVATALDELLATGDQPATALQRLEQSLPGVPKTVMAAVRAVHLHSAYMDIRFVGFNELAPGMVLDEDVVTDTGDTLMFRGEEVTRTLLDQLRPAAGTPDASGSTAISQKLRVLIPA